MFDDAEFKENEWNSDRVWDLSELGISLCLIGVMLLEAVVSLQ